MVQFFKFPIVSVLLYVSFLACCVTNVLSVPLGPDPKHVPYLEMEPAYKTVKAGFIRAQELVIILQRIFKTDNIQRTILLQYCFGSVTSAELHIIQANINLLADPHSVIMIDDVNEKMNAENKGIYAYTRDDTKPWRVTFTELFHTAPLRGDDFAGIIIHESAHILFKAVDWFFKAPPHEPTFEPNAPNYKGPPVWSGYEGDDFHIITTKAPGTSHHNADAYVVAAIMAGRIEKLHTREQIGKAITAGHAFSFTKLGTRVPDHVHTAHTSHRRPGSPK